MILLLASLADPIHFLPRCTTAPGLQLDPVPALPSGRDPRNNEGGGQGLHRLVRQVPSLGQLREPRRGELPALRGVDKAQPAIVRRVFVASLGVSPSPVDTRLGCCTVAKYTSTRRPLFRERISLPSVVRRVQASAGSCVSAYPYTRLSEKTSWGPWVAFSFDDTSVCGHESSFPWAMHCSRVLSARRPNLEV